MTVDQENVTVDQDALLEFIGRFVGDLGATTWQQGSVVVGHRLGLHSALAVGRGDEQLAERTGHEPAVRDRNGWPAKRLGDYVSYDAANRHLLAVSGTGFRTGRSWTASAYRRHS